MARCAILFVLICVCFTVPAFAKDINGYESEDISWKLGLAAEDSSLWGFRYLDLGWEGWNVLYDSRRIIEPREMQNWEDDDAVTVMSECLLIYSEGRLEMVMFDIADSDFSYRRLARIFNDYYDDEDNKLIVDEWKHRVWVDTDGEYVILNRYMDISGDVRTRIAYMTPSMGGILAGEAKPDWFNQLTDWIERRR